MTQDRTIFTPLSLLLFAGVSFLPVYIFESGGMQPTHLLLALFSVFVLFQRDFRKESWSLLLLALAAHVFIVEAFHGIAQGGDIKGTVNGAYFLYNFLLTAAVANHTERNGLKPLYVGVLVAASLATFTVAFTGVNLRDISETGRETGTFNNPNQLGFFSCCLLSTAYFLYNVKRMSYVLVACLMITAVFLAVVSLSKAAMIANGAVILLSLKPRFTKANLALWIVGIAAAILMLLQLHERGVFDGYLFVQRLQALSAESDSSLAARGYFVVLDAPAHQLLFGMGSSSIRSIIGHEVHSTLGSALNSYGIIGLVLMAAIFIIWTLKIYRHFGVVGVISIVSPSMLYGITHNGSRFVFFWILLASTIGYIHRVSKTSEIPAPVRAPTVGNLSDPGKTA